MRKQTDDMRIIRWMQTMIDPCKNCLVKPICQETCDKNQEYHEFRYELISIRRTIYEMGTGFLAFGMFALILWIIFILE